MTHQIYFRAVIAMSLETRLLNALKCHLVFAGSLQLAEGWGWAPAESGARRSRQTGWGTLGTIVPSALTVGVV